MGSAQSARRIQPGGVVRPCRRSRRIFPAPRSSRPLHPSSPSSAAPLRRRGACGGVGGRGRGWGRRGTAPRPATGRRRAHFRRGGAPRPAPGRLGRPRRGRWPGGAPPRSPRGGSQPAPGVTAPPRQQQLAESRGRGSETCVAALSPLPASAPAGVRPRGGSRAPVPGGPGRPSHGATALPAPFPLSRGGRGAGRTVPSAPRACRAVGRGGCFSGHARGPSLPLSLAGRGRGAQSERTGSAAMSATHPTRLETRTKESNTCASRGLARKPPWRNEGEGRRPARRAEVGSRGLSSPPRAHHRPVSPAAPGRWSTSARVRTRKMVNYAWAGRSQRKLWWRPEAILTCKSFV